jgi:hypothetical protein
MIMHMNFGGYVFPLSVGNIGNVRYIPVGNHSQVLNLGRFPLNVMPDNWGFR